MSRPVHYQELHTVNYNSAVILPPHPLPNEQTIVKTLVIFSRLGPVITTHSALLEITTPM